MASVLATFVVLLVSNMAGPIYPLWQQEMGFDEGTINVLFAVYPAGVLTALFVVARILKGVSWRSSLLLGTILAMISAILTLVADRWELLAVARYVSGLGIGVFLSVGASTMTAAFERRGFGSAARASAMVISMGFACGAPIAGVFADCLPDPSRLVFLVEAVALALVAIYVGADRGLRVISASARAVLTDVWSGVRAPMIAPADRGVAQHVATLVMVACGVCCAIFQSIGSAYLRDHLEVGTATFAGLLVFLVFGSGFSGQLILAGATSRVQAWVALTSGGLGAVILVISVMAQWIPGAFISAVLSGLSQGLGQAVGLTVARQTTDLDRLPGVLARLNALAYGTAGGAIVLAAPVVNYVGVEAAIAVLACGVLLMTMVAVISLAQHQRSLTLVRSEQPDQLAGCS